MASSAGKRTSRRLNPVQFVAIIAAIALVSTLLGALAAGFALPAAGAGGAKAVDVVMHQVAEVVKTRRWHAGVLHAFDARNIVAGSLRGQRGQPAEQRQHRSGGGGGFGKRSLQRFFLYTVQTVVLRRFNDQV